MRLDFQVMWFIIIFSTIKPETFTSAYPLQRHLRHHMRPKRLISYDYPREGQRGASDDYHSQRKCSRTGNPKSRGSGIAVKAAQEAKQANDEMANAVKIASDRIKLEYADKAASAAKAAEAVLSSKLQVLEQLEMEVREAEIVVQEETQELGSAESSCQLAQKAHQQAKDEQKLLQSALVLARDNLASAEQVASSCQQSWSEKTSLVETAQKRVGLLLRQLSEARADYTKTKKAAYRALCAANEAKQRIQQNQH